MQEKSFEKVLSEQDSNPQFQVTENAQNSEVWVCVSRSGPNPREREGGGIPCV